MSLDRLIESNVELQYPTSKPTYDLNFTRRTLKGIDPAYTFTRNSAATYIGPDGLIKTAAVNQPRFEFDPVTGEYRGLLIEESRINYQVTDIPNLTTQATILSTTELAPDRSSSALLLNVSSSGGEAVQWVSAAQTGAVVAGEYFTVSYWLKGIDGDNWIFSVKRSIGGGNLWQFFRTFTITSNWARYTHTFQIPFSGATAVTPRIIGPAPTNNIYIWGIQVERGSSATSYIPTSGSAVTRQPDQLVLNKSLNTQGTLYVESRPTSGISLVADNGSSPLAVSQNPNQYSKSILYYNTNRILRMSSDGGVPVDFSSSSSLSNLNRVSLGFDRLGNSNYINGHLKKFSYYSSPLTEDNLRALTGNKRAVIRFPSLGEPIVTSGLVLYLDAGNPASYPGSGTTWFDLSGNGNTGTLVNGVGYSGDNLGSLVFDGVNDRVTTSLNLNPFDIFSVNVWVYAPTTGQEEFILGTASGNGTERGFYISFYSFPNYGNDIRLACWNGGSFPHPYSVSTSANIFNRGGWNYIYYEFNGKTLNSTHKIIVNNNYTQTITVQRNFSTHDNNLNIGGVVGTFSVGYGEIRTSNVSIYNRALTAQEIQQNFNALRNRFGI
jgi:hypothetical protein